MPSQNITALTNAATPIPTALFYMAVSPFGVTDDRKITADALFSILTANVTGNPNLTAANVAASDQVFYIHESTSAAIVSVGGSPALLNIQATNSSVYWHTAYVNDAATHRYGLFINNTGARSGQLVWQAYDNANAVHGLNVMMPTGGFQAFSDDGAALLWVDQIAGAKMGAIWADADVFKLGVTVNTGTLGTPTQVLSWVETGIVQFGVASTLTGSLALANSASAFLTTIQAGNAAAARTYVWPTNFGASGAALTDAAGNGILSWVVPAAGGMAIGGTVTSGTAGSVLFVNAGPILAQDNANFFWDDTNNRLGLGTATPAKLLHVNGIAQLGTVSATTGQLQLANSASANLTTIQAGNAAAAVTYTWPTNVGASGAVLTDAAGNGTLSWAVPAGGGTAWSALTDPAGNLALTMAANTSTFTYNATTGATNLFVLTTGSNDTGTGYLFSLLTPGGTNAKSAFGVTAQGSLALEVRPNGSVHVPGTGGTDSLRVGINTLAGSRSTSVGPSATSTGLATTVVGWTAQGNATTASVAVGDSTNANGDNAIAIGQAASATTNAIAIGKSSTNGGARSIAIGTSSNTQSQTDTLVIGHNAIANGTNQIIMGNDASPYLDWYVGRGVNSATPGNITLQPTQGLGTDIVAGQFNLAGGRSTGSGVPGRVHIQGSTVLASGTTLQTLIDRGIYGATKVLANNTTTTVVNVTDASNTVASGIVDYSVEVFDGTDLQVETGSFIYQITNKGGTIANNTITFAGASGVGVTSNYPKNTTTSGTLVVTWTITAANPALLQINANSSLTPSTGFPRVTYTLRNLTSQAVAVV